jgi:hypothetical protein
MLDPGRIKSKEIRESKGSLTRRIQQRYSCATWVSDHTPQRLSSTSIRGEESHKMGGWRAQIFCTISVTLVLTTLSGAQDWSSCQHDLDGVKRVAQDASDAAEELESLENELQDKRSELQNCVSEPRIYDIYRDRCRSQRAEYEDARQDFSQKKARLQDELTALESRLRSVQLSCDYNFSFSAVVPRQSQQQSESGSFCSFLESYKSKLAPAKLLSICTKSMSVEDCRKCLK